MPNKEFHFTAISKITLEHEEGAQSSKLKTVDLRMEVSSSLERSKYIDGRGLPRKDALRPLTQALLQGLIVNVKAGGEKGWWSEAEHMKYIIAELGRSFVEVSEITESTMEY